MARLSSKGTSNKPKRVWDQHISNAIESQEDPLDIEVSPGMVSQECPPETESTNKEPLNGDTLLEFEEWSEELGRNMVVDESWKSNWVKYLDHNNSVLVQGKEFVKPHTLCLACKAICTHPKLLPSLLSSNWDDVDYYGEPSPRHYETIEELIISVSEGCHMCTMILYSLWSPRIYPSARFDFHYEAHGPASNEPVVELLIGFDDSEVGFFMLYPQSNQNSQGSLHSTQSKVLESPTKNISPWRTSTLSDETFQLARSWLNECTSHHECCNNLVDFHDVPTRLIHIASESDETFKVRLCVSKGLKSETQYLTLSHVWGDINNRFTLNTSNFEELVNSGICWQRLPKTFQDAILITHRLGFEYLWIDCLCIIQDSKEDWNREAPRMASVYGNSACNIAALGKDSHAGCFHDRNPLSYSPCRVLSCEQGDVYFCTNQSGTFNDSSIRLIKKAPLFKRAWVFQERMLAQRNIYFGDSQIHWDCIQGSACEVAPTITSTKETISPFGFTMGKKNSIGILQGRVDDLKKSEVQAAWQDLISVYNQLSLTVITDKLIALSAITNLFEKRFGLTYLDGLWKEHLPGGLLWHINYPTLKHSVTELPSWSWAAMNSDPKRFDLMFSTPSVDGQTKTMDARLLAYRAVQNATIGRDFLGDLPRYSLTLRGWIKPVKYLMRGLSFDKPLITEKGMNELLYQPYDLISVKGKKRLNISVHLDAPNSHVRDASCTPCETDPDFYYLTGYRPETLPEGYAYAKKQFRKVCLLLIHSGTTYDEEEGLVLEEYGSTPNHYIRVGHFSHDGNNVNEIGYDYGSLFGAEETDIEERTIELF